MRHTEKHRAVRAASPQGEQAAVTGCGITHAGLTAPTAAVVFVV